MKHKRSGLLLSILLLFWPISGYAATYYVSPSGNDASAGSSTAPWKTVQHAADTVRHNVLYENGLAGGAALNLASVRDTLIANNLIYSNHAGGIAAWDDDQGEEWGSKNNSYYNNTIQMPSDGRWAVNLKNGSSGSQSDGQIIISNVSPTMEGGKDEKRNRYRGRGAMVVTGCRSIHWRDEDNP